MTTERTVYDYLESSLNSSDAQRELKDSRRMWNHAHTRVIRHALNRKGSTYTRTRELYGYTGVYECLSLSYYEGSLINVSRLAMPLIQVIKDGDKIKTRAVSIDSFGKIKSLRSVDSRARDTAESLVFDLMAYGPYDMRNASDNNDPHIVGAQTEIIREYNDIASPFPNYAEAKAKAKA